MWLVLRRAAATARLKNAAQAFPTNTGLTDCNLTASCLGGLPVSGSQVSLGLYPCGHSETFFAWIRSFCSWHHERGTNSEDDGEFSDLDAEDSDPSCGNGVLSVSEDSEPVHGNCILPVSKELWKFSDKIVKAKASTRELSFSNKDPNSDKKLQGKNYRPYLFQVILDAPSNSLAIMLDKWIEGSTGNHLGRHEILQTLFHLKKQWEFRKALQFMEWLERGKLLNFEEGDYAGHLDLIARVHGIQSAQKYIERVPESFRNEVLYETLLVNCVRVSHAQKAQEIFKEIRDLSLPLTVSACNQLILLYKRIARSKVVDVLMLMEKENIKPSPFTYKLLIDLKGQSNDISGMELVLKEMKESGVEPDIATLEMIAGFYIDGGLTEKAEATLKEMELEDIKDKRNASRALLRLYAALGRPDDVGRIWKLCEANANLEDFLAAIEAWGKLGDIEEAERAFEAMLKTTLKPSSKYYNAMLSVYAENKHLTKGKELAKRMSIGGCQISPRTWDVLVKLYVNSGEVEKADSLLLNVTEQNPDRRPLYSSYIFLLKAYAEKSDIHNAEKIFDRMNKITYPGRQPPYGVLLEAYVNAKVPAHGFRERMRADNVLPIKQVKKHLELLEALPN